MANQNVTQLSQQTVSANASSLFYAVTGGTTDTGLPLSVLVNNLGLTGTPTAPTATTGTSTTQIASCAFVQNQLTSSLGSYMPLTGGTFTGVVTYAFSGANLIINDTSGANKTTIFLKNNGTTVWDITHASSGAAFALDRYNGGVYADSPIVVSNSTGVVQMQDGIAGTPVGAAGASTGAFTTLSASSTVSGTGFTNYLASPPAIGGTTPAAGSFAALSATGIITPSTTNGIKGTIAADNANAGSVGEFITATGTSVALTSSTPANVTSISLTAGDWDVFGGFQFTGASSAVSSAQSCGISTTSATFGGAGTFSGIGWSTAANGGFAGPTPTLRFNVSTTTTVFLVAQANYTPGTVSVSGTINARRRR